MLRPHLVIVSTDSDTRELYAAWFSHTTRLHLTCLPDLQGTTIPANTDVVLVDVASTRMWDDCARLATQDRDTPIVVLTGWVASDERYRQRAFAAGCAAFVAKPCHPRALAGVLHRVLQGERQLALT